MEVELQHDGGGGGGVGGPVEYSVLVSAASLELWRLWVLRERVRNPRCCFTAAFLFLARHFWETSGSWVPGPRCSDPDSDPRIPAPPLSSHPRAAAQNGSATEEMALELTARARADSARADWL